MPGQGIDVIAADAALQALTGADHIPHDDGSQAALDREDLLAVEYAEMGLPVPAHTPPAASREGILDRVRHFLHLP